MHLRKWLYGAIITLSTPFVLCKLLWRSIKVPAYFGRINERFLLFRPDYDSFKNCIWIHSVSVGETLVAVKLVCELLEQHPDQSIMLTTTTPTGSKRAQELLPEGVGHVYVPYDFPWAVRRFCAALSPKLVVMIEGEIWPFLFWTLAEHEIPLVIANARMSGRSYRGYGKVNWFLRGVWDAISLVASQSRADGARYIRLGVERSRVKVLGNLKYDVSLAEDTEVLAQSFRASLNQAIGPIVVAASTHPGEDELVIEAFKLLCKEKPTAILCLVPRHIERSPEIRELAENEGFKVVQRTVDQLGDLTPGGIYIADTMGELGMFYAAADVCFVGGSLVQIGGHNPIEPILVSCPVVVGPYLFNFTDIFRQLRLKEACLVVRNPEALSESWTLCLDQNYGQDMAKRALTVVKDSQGVLSDYLSHITSLIAT